MLPRRWDVTNNAIMSLRGLRCFVHPDDMGSAHPTSKAQPVERSHVMGLYLNVRRSHDGKPCSEYRAHTVMRRTVLRYPSSILASTTRASSRPSSYTAMSPGGQQLSSTSCPSSPKYLGARSTSPRPSSETVSWYVSANTPSCPHA